MLADNSLHFGFFQTAGNIFKKNKTVFSVGCFRQFIFRPRRNNIRRNAHRVCHKAFGRTGVARFTGNTNSNGICVKISTINFTQISPVNRISKISRKTLHVKITNPGTDFLINGESRLNRPMFNFRVRG